jgi:hypothetical protein
VFFLDQTRMNAAPTVQSNPPPQQRSERPNARSERPGASSAPRISGDDQGMVDSLPNEKVPLAAPRFGNKPVDNRGTGRSTRPSGGDDEDEFGDADVTSLLA